MYRCLRTTIKNSRSVTSSQTARVYHIVSRSHAVSTWHNVRYNSMRGGYGLTWTFIPLWAPRQTDQCVSKGGLLFIGSFERARLVVRAVCARGSNHSAVSLHAGGQEWLTNIPPPGWGGGVNNTGLSMVTSCSMYILTHRLENKTNKKQNKKITKTKQTKISFHVPCY